MLIGRAETIRVDGNRIDMEAASRRNPIPKQSQAHETVEC
jgi:hypothetical protein